MYYFIRIIILLYTVKLKSTEDQFINNNPILMFNFNRMRRESNTRESNTTSTTLPVCNEDQLMVYLAEIQVINPEKIIGLATLADLDHLCKIVEHNLGTIDIYLKTCEPQHSTDLYIQLIKGVDSLYDKLCNSHQFQTDFKHHLKCLHELHNEFEDCDGPADWNEDQEKENVCKAYREIADCYYVKAAKLCGVKAAKIMKELVTAIINSVIVVKCDAVKINPVVADPMPDSAKKNELNMLLTFVFFLKYFSSMTFFQFIYMLR